MYFLDLFSGIGGFALGAYWSGLQFDRHFYSDIDDYANKVYQLRFPDAEALGDIRNIKGKDLPNGEWIIAGGFPCQDISIAGKGAGLDGARSRLWYEYSRIIGELRPRFAIMENVGALAFRGLGDVLGSLAALGYDAEWQDIRASDVGAPHRRERIWIVAYTSSIRCDLRGFGREGIYGKESPCNETNSSNKVFTDSQGSRCERYERSERGSTSFSRSNLSSWWKIEPDVDRMANGIPFAVDRLKCLGNSIVPQIAELIFLEIKKQIEVNQ